MSWSTRVACPALAAIAAVSLASSCGAPPETSTGTGGGGTSSSGGCGSTTVECTAKGIQGCAPMFIGEDGLCRPSLDACPAGTIPRFEEGCVPVGIQGCAAMFIGEDGLCRPSVEACPPGTIPRFEEGCVPVGIPDCAPVFVEDDGLCHPTMAKCPTGTFAVPDEGCVPIDGPTGCGAETWGSIADDPGTVYVDPGYEGATESGSKNEPFTTLGLALTAVAPGGRIALAAGTYDEPAEITDAVEIVGRCPSMVHLQGTMNVEGFPVIVWIHDASGVTLRGVTIGGPGTGLWIDHAPGLAIDHVLVSQASTWGVRARYEETDLTMSHCYIEDTQPAPDGGKGRGMQVEYGAHVALQQTALFGNRNVGLLIMDAGTDVEATSDLVEATRPKADHTSGPGVQVEFGGHLTMSGSAIVANHETGLNVLDADSAAIAVGNIIEGTLWRESDEGGGRGVELSAGAVMTLESSALLGNHDAGIALFDKGTNLQAIGNLVRDTRRSGDTPYIGRGIAVLTGAHAILMENTVHANRGGGLRAQDSGTVVVAERNLVESTLPDEVNGRFGRGVSVDYGAAVTLQSNAIMTSREIGVVVFGETTLEVANNLIADTEARASDGLFGGGVVGQEGSTVQMRGNAVVGNRYFGVVASNSVVQCAGDLLAGTRPQQSDGEFGLGAGSFDDGHLLLDHCCVHDSRVAAVMVAEAYAEVDATLLSLVPTGKFTLQNPSTPVEGTGDGLIVLRGSRVDVSSTMVKDCARAAILFDRSSGTVSATLAVGGQFGIALQGSPTPTLSDDDVFEASSGQPILSGGDLAVPDTPDALPGSM